LLLSFRGTTFKVSLALDNPTNVTQQVVIPTTTPNETLSKVVELLWEWKVDSIGIASFGPIDINLNSKTYGFITTTPKPLWGFTNVVGFIKRAFEQKAVDEYGQPSAEYNKIKNIKIGFNTDCNAAAAAELIYGQNDDISSVCYITIGTGIGIGIALRNQIEKNKVTMITNMLHPEAGHIVVKKHTNETLDGSCPYHGDCLEGLSNNHATAQRAGVVESQLPDLSDDDKTWECTAYYIAQLCLNLIYTVSPEKIIIGGGLARRGVVMRYVRDFTKKLNNNYVSTKQLEDMDSYIVSSVFDAPESNTSPGAVGALWLAIE
jgi:fructokinase